MLCSESTFVSEVKVERWVTKVPPTNILSLGCVTANNLELAVVTPGLRA
jgi:hypothetical protein